jgi:hypothetical protein
MVIMPLQLEFGVIVMRHRERIPIRRRSLAAFELSVESDDIGAILAVGHDNRHRLAAANRLRTPIIYVSLKRGRCADTPGSDLCPFHQPFGDP